MFHLRRCFPNVCGVQATWFMSNQTKRKTHLFQILPPPKNKTQKSHAAEINFLDGKRSRHAQQLWYVVGEYDHPTLRRSLFLGVEEKTHGVKSQERWRHRTSNNLYSITIRTRRFYVEKFHQNHPKSVLRIKKTPRFGQLGVFFPLNKNMCCWGRLVALSFWGPVKFQGSFCWTMLNFRGVNCKIPLSEGSSLK